MYDINKIIDKLYSQPYIDDEAEERKERHLEILMQELEKSLNNKKER